MPVEIIRGEISLLIRNSQGLLNVPDKPYLYVKLKRVNYEDDGSRKKLPPLVKICSRFARESGDIDQRIPITQFNGLDKNRQADTMTLEFYMKPDEQPSDAGASFIGECFVPFKKCFVQNNLNNWIDYQMFLSDETGKASQLVSGQVNISVRFIQFGHKDSQFNEDGTKKEKKATASQFVKIREEEKVDYRASKVGAAGSLTCKPMTIRPN